MPKGSGGRKPVFGGALSTLKFAEETAQALQDGVARGHFQLPPTYALLVGELKLCSRAAVKKYRGRLGREDTTSKSSLSG